MRKRTLYSLAIGILLSFGAFIAQSQAQPAELGDYWNGQAKWELIRKWTPANSGIDDAGASHIEVLGSTWYLFSRYYVGQTCANGTFPKLGIRVFRSTDQGATWSQPTIVLLPSGSSASSCATTDGDAFYDAANNKWHLLYQCLGNDGAWRGCHAERAGTDPMGPFTPNSFNPVINPYQLWSRICNNVEDDCVQLSGGINRVFDEGTFNIFRYDGLHFWVSFHGYDGKHGYRGIAKTTNFVHWIAGDPTQGLPADAVIDANDARNWRENWNAGGPIGAGAGSILWSNDHYYLLAEVPDLNLACTSGQNWNFGLFRSSSLDAIDWEQYPSGNPIVYSSREPENGVIPPCNVQYPQLFSDQAGNTYLKHYRASSRADSRGTYLYRLVPSHNVLVNGDLWMGQATGWTRLPASPANLTAYRWPNWSSDGGPFLATNCGTGSAPCSAGQSVYQDVNVVARRGKYYDFGGKFSTHSGSGVLSLAVWQLDANFNTVQVNSVPVQATANSYTAAISSRYVIQPATKYLRYQFYFNSNLITYYADEMYLNIYP